MFTVAAFYKFVQIEDIQALQATLMDICKKGQIKGTILVAPEGINGTIAGPDESIKSMFKDLMAETRFKGLSYKESKSAYMPFYRLKVRLKKELITMKAPEADPTKEVGTYVKPEEWNALLQDPEVVVLDTRNDYEVNIGTFKNAVNPDIQVFTQFKDFVSEKMDPKKHKKVAMFCTGGIRCEKASSYMMAHGFDEVYHLEGGILKYLETIPADQSLWEGECFVFDNRTAITHGLNQGTYDLCHGCRHPISDLDKQSPFFEKGVTCPSCYNLTTDDKIKRARSRQHQVDLAHMRNQKHIGSPE